MTRRTRIPWSACTLIGALLLTRQVDAQAVAMPALRGETCSLDGLLEQIRKGLNGKSQAYRNYVRNLLRESAVNLSAVELRAAFTRETHPILAEHLAAALVARTERGADSSGMSTVAQRALAERDPAVRAAVVRSLRRTSAIENTGDLYERLVRDPSPEVRREVATNIVEDNQHVYSGHHGPAADAAVRAATTATDPAVTAQILGNISTEAVSHGAAELIREMLHSEDASVRRAAAVAMGGVPAAESVAAQRALLDQYRDERDAGVRKGILQGLAQLGFSGAIPELQRLREIDSNPNVKREAELWIKTLRMGLPEWSLILREKQRLEQAQDPASGRSGHP